LAQAVSSGDRGDITPSSLGKQEELAAIALRVDVTGHAARSSIRCSTTGSLIWHCPNALTDARSPGYIQDCERLRIYQFGRGARRDRFVEFAAIVCCRGIQKPRAVEERSRFSFSHCELLGLKRPRGPPRNNFSTVFESSWTYRERAGRSSPTARRSRWLDSYLGFNADRFVPARNTWPRQIKAIQTPAARTMSCCRQ